MVHQAEVVRLCPRGVVGPLREPIESPRPGGGEWIGPLKGGGWHAKGEQRFPLEEVLGNFEAVIKGRLTLEFELDRATTGLFEREAKVLSRCGPRLGEG